MLAQDMRTAQMYTWKNGFLNDTEIRDGISHVFHIVGGVGGHGGQTQCTEADTYEIVKTIKILSSTT